MPSIVAYLRGGDASGETHEVPVREGVELPNRILVDDMVYQRGKQLPLAKGAWNFLYVGPYRPHDNRS